MEIGIEQITLADDVPLDGNASASQSPIVSPSSSPRTVQDPMPRAPSSPTATAALISQHPRLLRCVPFFLLHPRFLEKQQAFVALISELVSHLSEPSQAILTSWLIRWPREYSLRVLHALHTYLKQNIHDHTINPLETGPVLSLIKLFFNGSLFVSRLPFSYAAALPLHAFYNPSVNTLHLIEEINRIQNRKFALSCYAHLLSVQRKSELLRIETTLLRETRIRSEILFSMVRRNDPLLRLFLRRDHLIEDTLVMVCSFL